VPICAASGKGRKDRMTPLTTQTAAVLRTWSGERDGTPGDPLFPTRRGGPPNEDEIHQPKGTRPIIMAYRRR
jgi:integrase/recombinase XerD